MKASAMDFQGQADEALKHSGTVELIISLALRCGMLISSILMAAGTMALFLSPQRSVGPAVFSVKQPSSANGAIVFHSLNEVVHGLSDHEPNAVIALGLLILIITPIIPVAFSAALFLLQRDKPFVLIALLVLAILAGSFFLGFSAS